MIIVKLDVNGPRLINIGVFSSEEKADKEFERFKDAHKGTEWQDAEKVLSAWNLDIGFDGNPV